MTLELDILIEEKTKSTFPVQTYVDTSDFMKWACQKYNMTSNEWHKKIWRSEKGLLYYIEGDNKVTFTQDDVLPNELLNEHLQDFFNEFPEFNGKVSMIFT